MARAFYVVDDEGANVEIRISNPGGTYVDILKPEQQFDDGYVEGGSICLDAITVLKIAAILRDRNWTNEEDDQEVKTWLANVPK